MSQQIGIYKIESPSGKCYVGMTTDSFDGRWSNHRRELRTNRHKCKGLQRAFVKYGENYLNFIILEVMPANSSDSAILLRERDWWDTLKSQGVQLYNGRPSGTGGVHHTPESKALIGKALERDDALHKILRKCDFCQIGFFSYKRHKAFCSRKCSNLSSVRFDYKKAIELYDSGMSLRQVAEEVNVSHISVRNVLLSSGYKLRTKNPSIRKI